MKRFIVPICIRRGGDTLSFVKKDDKGFWIGTYMIHA